MDLKSYYRRMREVEAEIPEESVVLVSRATPDGGRAGLLVEAPRAVAARLIAEGAAERAPAPQAAEFRKGLQAARVQEEGRRAAARIQVSVITEAEARALSEAAKSETRPADRKRNA